MTTAEPQNRAGIRFKKVGNLVTLEQAYQPGTRAASLNRTGRLNDTLILRKNINELQLNPNNQAN